MTCGKWTGYYGNHQVASSTHLTLIHVSWTLIEVGKWSESCQGTQHAAFANFKVSGMLQWTKQNSLPNELVR